MNVSKILLWCGAALSTVVSCSVDTVPTGLRATPPGNGPVIVFDTSHRPLPEIPLPNDVATWPDPTSRTGRRINASLAAPTIVEHKAREHFSRLEGWGTYAPISIPFDKPLHTDDLRKQHDHDDHEFKDDA